MKISAASTWKSTHFVTKARLGISQKYRAELTQPSRVGLARLGRPLINYTCFITKTSEVHLVCVSLSYFGNQVVNYLKIKLYIHLS